ncbi:rhodanese-like domain-containing protein [Leptospira adleri]|nr:rhodanese-like domain-containing protein [Leptospira adleri]
MKKIGIILILVFCTGMIIGKGKRIQNSRNKIPNRLIDYDRFQKTVNSSGEEREARRLTEDEFLTTISEKDVILLDARSESRFKLRHIKGAINLPFTEFTKDSLAKVIPNLDTKILIYCNNNFDGSPEAFAAKNAAASLNLSTFISLKVYGYTNIYELGPLLDVAKTKLPFEGSEVQ